MDDSIDH